MSGYPTVKVLVGNILNTNFKETTAILTPISYCNYDKYRF